MENQRITPLMEGGLLTAITVIMALMAVYLPVLGMVAALLWAVPVVLLVVRHGFRWGIMAILVAGILMAVLIEPVLSLRMVLSFAPTGLLLGYGFRRGWSGTRTFLGAALASIGAKGLSLGLVFAMTSVSPLDLQLEGMQEAFNETFAMYEAMGMDEAAINGAKGQVSEAMLLVGILMPLVFVITGLVDTAVDYLVSGRIMKRLGISIAQFPPFREWRLSQAFLYLMGFSLVGLYWGGTREIEALYTISLNANVLALLAGLLQGFSLLVYVCNRYRISFFLRAVMVLLVLANGFLLHIVAFTGLFDMVFDYRRRFGGAEKN